ncbi:helix-turn-helix domain-containing protein [Halomicrococcus sp. NG-SE-24]|uniref:helix-turn-helix domain-containing protein n=1 Tax=Halomicrococcus sp. NG-SE-24 TaxID=3436928 RepID=UPI003D958D49
MSTIAEVELPADEFALRKTLNAVPDAEFNVLRVAAHDDDSVLPYMWAESDDFDALDDALSEDPSIDGFEVLEDLGDERLYRMNWVESIEVIVHVLVEEKATVLNAHGEYECWRLRLLFPDRNALSATYDFCDDSGLSLDIRNIYEMNDTRHGLFGLTEEQHETLMMALDEGYYDIPRDSTADDLADGLDISHQAVSERLRRGHRSLVKNALAIGPEERGNRTR